MKNWIGILAIKRINGRYVKRGKAKFIRDVQRGKQKIAVYQSMLLDPNLWGFIGKPFKHLERYSKLEVLKNLM